MAIFGRKPWVNSFGKIPTFRLFELLVFIAWKGVFSFENIIKDIFWLILPKEKKLEKCQFFDFLIFLFFQTRKAFFRSRISEKTFSWPILPKTKKLKKMAIFEPKPTVNPFGEMSIFRLFELLVFIAWKGVSSFQNIIKDIFLAFIA